jgi:hypothetical protein
VNDYHFDYITQLSINKLLCHDFRGEKKTIAKVHLLSGKQIEHGVNGSKVGS